MQIPATSRQTIYIPVDPPPAIPDITIYACEAALIADDGSEPASSDWQPAEWSGGEVALLVGPGGPPAILYAPGEYMAFARITAGAEQPVIRSGRVRIGGGPP